MVQDLGHMDLLEEGREKETDLNMLGELHEPTLKLAEVFLWIKKIVKSVDGRDQTLLLKFTHKTLLSASSKTRLSYPFRLQAGA